MSLTRIYAVVLRQVYLIRGNPTRLFSMLLWLIIVMLQWGFITKYLSTFGSQTFSFINVILGAIILWEFVGRIQQGIMTSFLEDIWSQNFINFFASPLRLTEYIGGLVLTSILLGVAGLFLMVTTAGAAFGYDIFKLGLLLVPYLVILFIFGTSMGIFVSAIIFRLGPSAEWLGWPIPVVLSVFAGVFYPVAVLPVPMQVIARIIPASYVFESLRGILSSRTMTGDLGLNLLIGGLLSLAYLIAAYAFFVRVYRHNLRTGAIARFAAESL